MSTSTVYSLFASLIRPRAAFDVLAKQPRWLVAFVVGVLASAFAAAAIGARVDIGALLAADPALAAELDQATIDTMAMAMRWLAPVTSALSTAVVCVSLGLVSWLVLRTAGNGARFKATLSVSLHAMIPIFVREILSGLVALLRSEVTLEQFESSNMVASNLGYFFPSAEPSAGSALLQSIDLFTLWAAVLFVVGLTRSLGVSKGAAVALTTVLWVGGALLHALVLA